MQRLLYVDAPFCGIPGGDTNRSNFIWEQLSRAYAADLLIIKTEPYRYKEIPPHRGYQNLYTIAAQKCNSCQPQAIYSFHPQHLSKLKEILRREQYELVVFRFLSTFHLAELAARSLPFAQIAIDVDMLFSRIASLSWNRHRNIHNRFHFFEYHKLRFFERRAFQRDFRFFFTNPIELEMAVNEYDLKAANALHFPNMMPDKEKCQSSQAPPAPYVLFFGTLNSMANSDAIDHFMRDIYPRVKEHLTSSGIEIRIVGKNPLPRYQEYADEVVKIIGSVEDIGCQIAQALFVILPLQVASGTRTRILEAAEYGKAVISSSIGAEGFEFSNSEILFADKAPDFANAIMQLVAEPESAVKLGKALHDSAIAKYSAQVVSDNFLNALRSWNQRDGRRLKLAIITNRFYPEVGGAETNIYFQAQALAKEHEVTIFCPKRIDAPSNMEMDGFKVKRLKDLLNSPARYPNLKSKTFCPSLAWHLLKGDYDIIQCFPALNYNNMLAFWISRIRKTPFIQVFFDFIDYAAEIARDPDFDPDILKKIKPRFYQIPILRGMEQAFAIADKEIAFLKQYNEQVLYSPVPVLSEEYEQNYPRPALLESWEPSAFTMLCLGRISRIKGQDIALKAFCKVAAKMPEARLIFVGRTDYEPELFEQMQEIVKEYGLGTRVFFTGMLERSEVLAWLKHCDIHVIPVRFMNSGAVVVESFFSHTPVIQSDVVDPNLVIEGENGYLFPRASVEGCAAKMLVAYQERGRLAEMGKGAKAKVKDIYTYSYLTKLYNDTYYSLLKRDIKND